MPSMVWNYLRVRGEYAEAREKKIGMLELPPRTRRILQLDNIPTVPLGTTSAYAENTGLSNNLYSTPLELPPRTRRILAHELGVTILMGTTSAYAENTTVSAAQRPSPGNYLRVRGEYPGARFDKWRGEELPPRTRRILSFATTAASGGGTTSAYAENTRSGICGWRFARNYLRVRGEYWTALRAETLDGELPPRTRRIHASAVAVWSGCGTTSAYAENTHIRR